jgi:EAL domain-containing protein (putative c-di-GMP-specific phosphodiesterase class I)
VPADDAVSRRSLQGLRELGVNLVIDNFGTGFASLGWLHDLPFSAVKIDRRLTAGLGRNRTSMAIVRAIAALAQSLDLVVTAKGIETVEQLAHVRSLEIERGQGYYFSRPLPGDAILRLIAGPAPLDVGLLSVG